MSLGIQKEFWLGTTTAMFDQVRQDMSLETNENMRQSIALSALANAKQTEDKRKWSWQSTWRWERQVGISWRVDELRFVYGPKSSFTNVVTNKDLSEIERADRHHLQISRKQSTGIVLRSEEGRWSYCIINQYHILPEKLNPVPTIVEFKMGRR